MKISRKTGMLISACAALPLAGWGIQLYLASEARQDTIKADARREAVEMIAAISRNWDAGELQKRIHPVFADALKRDQQSLDDVFAIYKTLGKQKNDAECKVTKLKTGDEPAPYDAVDFVCTVEYEHGTGEVTMELLKDKQSPDFLITTFRVNSDAFNNLSGQ